jgi:RNA polymerase sigma-70 factor (ECF subfamily)
MAANPTDASALLRAHLAGDGAAFARLYDTHDRHCFDFIRRLLGAPDDATAEDLHQEVWLAVARSAASFDPGKARFVTWLFTIARNKVMDHFRRTPGVVHLVPGPDDEEAADNVAAHTVSPEDIAQNRELAAALLHAVQALPFVQREAFVLFAQQDLSLDEVAQITGVGLETAKSRLRYARATLRQRLAPWKVHHA